MKKVLVTVERWECDLGHQHTRPEVAAKCDAKAAEPARESYADRCKRQFPQAKIILKMLAEGATRKEAGAAVGISASAADRLISKYARLGNRYEGVEQKDWLGIYARYSPDKVTHRLLANCINTLSGVQELLASMPKEWWLQLTGIGEKEYQEIRYRFLPEES